MSTHHCNGKTSQRNHSRLCACSSVEHVGSKCLSPIAKKAVLRSQSVMLAWKLAEPSDERKSHSIKLTETYRSVRKVNRNMQRRN